MSLAKPTVSAGMSPRQLALACDAWYETPKKEGAWAGPLVGYAGRDSKDRNFVGDTYLDFAKIDQWPTLAEKYVARPLLERLDALSGGREFVYCGAPEGGKVLATLMARVQGTRYVFPEKVEVTDAPVTMGRIPTTLAFARHSVYRGERLVIVEDVCNNFSTTHDLIGKIRARGGSVAAIVCFWNRSSNCRGRYFAGHEEYPVISLWDEPAPQWEQDYAPVAAEIVSGNISWKPKLHWARLREIQQKGEGRI